MSLSPFNSLNGSPNSRRRQSLALHRRQVFTLARGSDPNLLRQRRNLEAATPPERWHSA
jgi:hypothetical protein